ncbi:MAG TPA: excinuclease ABC subunit UvrA [Bacteroidales bacterium]|nr:excinuclease ABC subunit UvrA [Bacteroidales bacterium]
MSDEFIRIKGAKVNNLKNIDVDIPRNKIVVITGLSGSGKSSLAFDTLYAEGQRRYVESLSSYARQFMGKLSKPEVESIKGLPPAIAIEQKVISRNPRSTIGSTTEIYEYLKLLFARIGRTYSPVSGKEVKREDIKDVVHYIKEAPADSKIYILAPFIIVSGRSLDEQLEILKMQGFSRIIYNNILTEIDDLLEQKKEVSKQKKGETKVYKNIQILIDRFKSSMIEEYPQRLHDSIQTAFSEGKGTCIVQIEDGTLTQKSFINQFEMDGISFVEPTPHLFSFNNPYGACKVCNGIGSIDGFDIDILIPDKTKSVFDNGVEIWNNNTFKDFKALFIKAAVKEGFHIHKPIHQLTREEVKLLFFGDPEKKIVGIYESLELVEKNPPNPFVKIFMSRFKGKTTCPICHGSRLRPDAAYVKVNGLSITEMVEMPIDQLYTFFKKFKFRNETEEIIAQHLVNEILNRLKFVYDVGLGYLTLNRNSRTLSGGESQRINLATTLGSSLVGSLYILDEPSIGLHSRDTDNLIQVLKRLRDIGNTVVVVEHDEEIIRNADYIIDIGPLAGRLGGEVVFTGTFPQLIKNSENLTAKYIRGMESPLALANSNDAIMRISLPATRRKWKNYVEIRNAHSFNLKNLTVKFPLDIFTVVTGVSGSGKSTLVKKELFTQLERNLDLVRHISKDSDTNIYISKSHLSKVVMIDQNPIGKSTRSNPATYLKIFDDIRELYAQQPLAIQRNYKASFFTFNREGGRCETCQGEGVIHISMQFMADVDLLCTDCNGKRYKEDVLDVKISNNSISDILDMTINQALEFFTTLPHSNYRTSIINRLKVLIDVGLGYLKLGQSSSTLSGGEAQRIKLALYLSQASGTKEHVFIFDEPTTGLHFHDIHKLYHAFNKLIEIGNTVIVIEHNTELIKCADWIIDLGPEGGNNGGTVVFEGTPEELIKCKSSYTGKYLIPKLT